MMNGLADEDICKEALAWGNKREKQFHKSKINETWSNDLTCCYGSVSSYKSLRKIIKKSGKITWNICGRLDKNLLGALKSKYIECSMC